MYYDKIIKIYDLIYESIDYQFQTKWVNKYVKQNHLKKKVLDIACGSGKNLYFFNKLKYDVHGCDLSKEMIKITRKRVPQAKVQQCSFKNLKSKENFPLITCFFNSLSYNLTSTEMENTFSRVINILEQEGLFIFDIYLSNKQEEVKGIREYKKEKKYITRTFIGIPKGKKYYSTMVYVYFDGKKTQVIKEESIRGSFSLKEILRIIKRLNLKILYKGEGYWKNKGAGLTTFVLKKEVKKNIKNKR